MHARIPASMTLLSLAALAAPALADIDLELRPASPVVAPGGMLDLGLYAVSDDAGSQFAAAIEVVFTWDPAALTFDGIDPTGAVTLLSSVLPVTSPLNEADPPADGDAFYSGLGLLGTPIEATPAGTLVTTLRFTAGAGTTSTLVSIVAALGGEDTIVFDGIVPNTDVTGALGAADVEIGTPCPADVNGDDLVDVADLVAVVLGWGGTDPALDIDGSGLVDVADLVAVVLGWGACPAS